MTSTLLNNRYKVLSILGGGGFGETFLAEDTQMPSGKRCVIKQLKPISNNSQMYELVQQRFQQEAAILEELGDRCDQIPRLYAYFSENGQFYLVQEYIQGQTLTQKVQQYGLMTENAVKEILLNLLPVLDFIHSQRMVHRDIKPDNIILRNSDSKPVLIDFGAVKVTMQTEVLGSPGNASKSIVIGTPGFMPGEQSIGKPLFSSDLYSLGLTAIYLLTGRMPQNLTFDAPTGEILWRHFAGNINSSFADVLDKAIKKSPRDRYFNSKEMLAAIQNPQTPLVIPPTVPPTPPVISKPTVISAPTPQPVAVNTPLPPTVASPPVPPSPQPSTVINQNSVPLVIPPKHVIPWWQQGLMIGGCLGLTVIGGWWFWQQQNISDRQTPLVTSETITASPTAQPSNNLSSETTTPTSKAVSEIKPTPINTSNTGNSDTTTDSQKVSNSQTTPSTNNSKYTGTSAVSTSLSQTAAQDLIQQWLQAKKVMFAPPYNTEIAAQLTTGQQYESAAGKDGSINSLKEDGHYYKYGVQKIDNVDEFSVKDNQATIQVKVTEERTLFDRNGNIIPKESDYKTRTVRYNLESIDGTWKISDSKIISN